MKKFVLVANLALFVAVGAAVAQSSPPQPSGQARPARVRTKMDGFDLSPNSGKKATQVGAASRDLGTPALLAPTVGKAFSTTPTFNWVTAQKGDKVTFKLMTMDGQVVYQTATITDHLRYPDDAPALKPGTSYKWTISPENDVLGGAPAPVQVNIVAGSERDAIKTAVQSATGPDAMARVFVDHRVWYDAIAGYTAALDTKPDDQDARAGRAGVYDQLPVTKGLADADWAMVH
jgi:hypothetical protein